MKKLELIIIKREKVYKDALRIDIKPQDLNLIDKVLILYEPYII